MKLVFDLDDVICTPPKGINFGIVDYIKNAKPIEDVAEFMQWAYKHHEIIIWAARPNDLAVKLATEKWLEEHGVRYHRLLLDKPDDPIFVNETPSHAKFYRHYGDLEIVAELYEEWKKEWKNDRQHKQRSGDTR
jgi:hypothetical protein|tara:strand:+ start:758 stop:1159 length:402 start_codon:yes stop_codon:yes gene_type:complete